MSRRSHLVVAGMGALAALGLAVPATAQGPGLTVKIVGGPKVKPGKSFSDNQRFVVPKRGIASGGTLTIRNQAKSEDPHSFSLVKASDLPRTAAAMNKCFEGGVCSEFETAHEAGPDGPPKKPLVNVGAEGFDQAGDSVVFQGKAPVEVEVTAKSGTTLNYLCAIHPWMQGKLRVR